MTRSRCRFCALAKPLCEPFIRRDLREAVERLHESGVCHLDLAPRNVLLNKDNTLTIIDFGRASLTKDAVARQQDLDALDTNF